MGINPELRVLLSVLDIFTKQLISHSNEIRKAADSDNDVKCMIDSFVFVIKKNWCRFEGIY